MGQFEENLNSECAVYEAMCPEAVDGTLTEAERRAFDKHIAGCVHCAQELAEAQRGAAWLGMLKGHTPEPPASLMDRILSQTTGVAANALPAYEPEPVSEIWTRPRQPVAPEPRASWYSAAWARASRAFRVENTHSNFQPRFAMTAAMAFFSIALSLNLMGISLRDLGSLSFRSHSLSRTVADAGASAERKLENNRLFYQLESRVNDLKNDDNTSDSRRPAPSPAPANKPDQPQPQQPTPHGSSQLMMPPSSGSRNNGLTVAGGEV